jgi:hypothetical protein
MKPALALMMLLVFGLPAAAQQDGVVLEQFSNPNAPAVPLLQPVEEAPGAILRGLDKTLGRSIDIDIARGQTVLFGRIAVRLLECRYPSDNPASDAFAHLQILDLEGAALFDGWMVASSPALVALEHPRYDVWVLRCRIS